MQDISHAVDMIREDIRYAVSRNTAPHTLMRPELKKITKVFGEGKAEQRIEQWRASYGDFSAYGDSPSEAMENFDQCWTDKLTEPLQSVG